MMRSTLHPIACAVILGLAVGGCGFAPGMYMSSLTDSSDIDVPVNKDGEPSTERAKITRITAPVVVEQSEMQRKLFDAFGRPPKVSYERYKLGPRDILSITVWDHPELTIPAGEFRSAEAAGTIINEDGTLFYPYVGVVKAAGLTVDQLRNLLIRKIATYIENPQLDVRVAAYRSKKVYIVGEVKTAGIQFINDIPMTVAEAVNRAGGVTEVADQHLLTLSRNGKVYPIDLLGMYENGDLQSNVLMQDGDILNVWDNSLNKVFVIGEVGNQRTLLMNKGRMSLAEAIGDAGGFDLASANTSNVFVIRTNVNAKPEIFHLDASTADAMLLADRFPLRARDVVYVDTAGVTRWNRVISQILPTAQTLQASTATHFPLWSGQTTTQINAR